MASLIPGFEYDIFISYRQKDNKHDGWITEFVNELKGELESAFKEEISVYFDINPHNGLLETHDVDASLKEKMRCLIFIPIISRTYCDPRSFAWQNEFKAFVEIASKDKFGLKVKLPNGNVASRVLSVRIHELDQEDLKDCESVIGGYLRGVEFIYKEPGVNRPLTKEDDEKINLNKTRYRNQINKVANSIREILSALKKEQLSPLEQESRADKVKRETGNRNNRLVLLRKGLLNLRLKNRIIIVLSALLILAASFIIYRLINEGTSSRNLLKKEKSIAVLAFHNFSDDPNQRNVSDGLTNEIINHLYKIKSFDKVISLPTVLTYKGTAKRIPEIADELKVNYILDGTYRKVGEQVRVTVQLIDPERDNNIWQNEYDKPYNELVAIQADIALQIANQVKAFITSSEEQSIRKNPTKSQEAYELIQKGLYLWNTGSRDIEQMVGITQKAIALDPDYADAYAFAGICSLLKLSVWGGSELKSVINDVSSYLGKALELDPNNCTAHLGMAWFNDWISWDYAGAEKEFLKILELEPNNPLYPELYVEFLLKRDRPDEALNYKITSEQSYRLIQARIMSGKKKGIYGSLRNYIQSQGITGLKFAGDCCLWMESYDSALYYFESAMKSADRPRMLTPRFQSYQALAYNKTGHYAQAQNIINQLTSKGNETTGGNPDYFAGWYYSGIGNADSAFYWLEKALVNRSIQLSWLKADPVFKNIRPDKRFPFLYERTGHKAYDDYIAGKK